MNLWQFLGALRARWRFGLLTFLAGTVATMAIVLTMAPQYGSSVKLFISTPTGGQAEYAASFIVTQRVASYADLALDPAVLQDVIDSAGLDITFEELAGQIEATVVTSTQTIQIDVTADTPELAQEIADAEARALVDLVRRLERPSDEDDVAAIAARVTGEPSFSTEPVAPNLPITIGAGLLISLFAAIAGALLKDLMDRTVKERQDVERILGSTVLATLPFDPQVKNRPLSAETGGSLAEAFRVLRTNLQFADLDASRQAILVSSAVPDEGKTLVATNLALSMAQSGRSVLLVDADMRNPNVAALLGLENSVGVVTVLVGRSTVEDATQSHVSGISFLGTGPMPPNPAEVLETQTMRDLIAQVRGDYDAVIIDAPPMLPVADASILVNEVDGVLLVVRHGSTTREQLRAVSGRIQNVGGRLFGAVLNRTPRRHVEGYGYGQGYGYGYGNPAVEVPGPVPAAAPEATPAGAGAAHRFGRAGRRVSR